MKLFVGPPTSAEAVDETKKDEPETAKVHEPKVFTVMPQPMPVAIQLPPSPPPPPRRRSFCTPLLVALCCAFFFFVLVVASLHGPYIGHRWHKDRAEHLIIDLGPLKALQDDVKSAALTSENKKEDEETKDEKMKVLLQSGPAASKMFIFGQQETDTPKEEKPVEEEERPRSIFLFRPLMQNLEERRPLHPYEVQPFEGGPNPWEEMAARREMAMRLWRWRRIQEAMMAERAAREQFMAFRLRQFAEFQHQRQLEEEQAAVAAHWQQMQFLQQQQQQQQQQQAPVQEESTPFVPPFLLRRAILQHLISQGAIPQPRVFMFLQRPPQFQQQQPFQQPQQTEEQPQMPPHFPQPAEPSHFPMIQNPTGPMPMPEPLALRPHDASAKEIVEKIGEDASTPSPDANEDERYNFYQRQSQAFQFGTEKPPAEMQQREEQQPMMAPNFEQQERVYNMMLRRSQEIERQRQLMAQEMLQPQQNFTDITAPVEIPNESPEEKDPAIMIADTFPRIEEATTSSPEVEEEVEASGEGEMTVEEPKKDSDPLAAFFKLFEQQAEKTQEDEASAPSETPSVGVTEPKVEVMNGETPVAVDAPEPRVEEMAPHDDAADLVEASGEEGDGEEKTEPEVDDDHVPTLVDDSTWSHAQPSPSESSEAEVRTI